MLVVSEVTEREADEGHDLDPGLLFHVSYQRLVKIAVARGHEGRKTREHERHGVDVHGRVIGPQQLHGHDLHVDAAILDLLDHIEVRTQLATGIDDDRGLSVAVLLQQLLELQGGKVVVGLPFGLGMGKLETIGRSGRRGHGNGNGKQHGQTEQTELSHGILLVRMALDGKEGLRQPE